MYKKKIGRCFSSLILFAFIVLIFSFDGYSQRGNDKNSPPGALSGWAETLPVNAVYGITLLPAGTFPYAPSTASFGPDTLWGNVSYTDVACVGVTDCRPNFGYHDVDGDGRADFVYQRDGTNQLRVMLSTGRAFGSDAAWGNVSYTDVACVGVIDCRPNFGFHDFDGDGRADFVYQRDGTTQLRVILSTGRAFGPDAAWGNVSYTRVACVGVADCRPNFGYHDVDGDGRADFVYQRDGTTQLRVILSTGRAFGSDAAWGNVSYTDVACVGVTDCRPNFGFHDVDGDGRADFVYQRNGTTQLRVKLSMGRSFGSDTAWGNVSYTDVACVGVIDCRPNFGFHDVNGDGRADFVYQRNGTTQLRVILSTGRAFGSDTAWGNVSYTDVACAGVADCRPNFGFHDVDGDGRADFVYQRDGSTDLRVMLSTGNSFGPDTLWGNVSYTNIACVGVTDCRPNFGYHDVNGDGGADFVYQKGGTTQLRVKESDLSATSGIEIPRSRKPRRDDRAF